MKKTCAVATIVLLACSLAGCGGSKDDTSNAGSTSNSKTTSPTTTPSSSDDGGSSASGAYCAAIQSVKDDVTGLNTISQDAFDNLTSKVTDIEAAAPAGVAGDWKTLGDYLIQFNALLKGAGISLDDLQGMQAGHLPKGVTQAQLTKLATKISSLGTTSDVEGASNAITASVKKDCGIDLDSSGTSTGGGSSSGPASGAPSS